MQIRNDLSRDRDLRTGIPRRQLSDLEAAKRVGNRPCVRAVSAWVPAVHIPLFTVPSFGAAHARAPVTLAEHLR
jgi:hypothetical protein